MDSSEGSYKGFFRGSTFRIERFEAFCTLHSSVFPLFSPSFSAASEVLLLKSFSDLKA